jgi:trigger factor
MRLQAQGVTIDQYFATSGQDQESFVNELRETATEGVKVDLALRAVAEAEEIEPTDEDLDAEYESVAARVGQKSDQVRKQFERNQQVPLVRSDLRKRKALEWLIERVEIVDEQGQPVDRAALEVGDDTDDEAAEEAPVATADESADTPNTTPEDAPEEPAAEAVAAEENE